MIKQFLLNPDGTIPSNVNVNALIEAGYKFVIPTPMPRESGMVAVEQEPKLIGDVWYQDWKLEPLPQEDNQEQIQDGFPNNTIWPTTPNNL